MLDNSLAPHGLCAIQDRLPPHAGAAGHSIDVECGSRPDHPLGRIELMADNQTPIAGGAPARNHFPQTVARLNVQATRAVLLDLCHQALENGEQLEEIAAFLADVQAEMLALVEAAAKERGL